MSPGRGSTGDGHSGYHANPTSYSITIAAAVVLGIVLSRENKKREDLAVNEEERDRLAFMDLTDKENPYFRYVL